ncbi:hypothetical protein DFJ74DRAFT_665494 [Hyaloraphidium curvatum]|nr:hypothetical protein DFJ74DRAFT_665494 [Hyaloraphidium curvatum]
MAAPPKLAHAETRAANSDAAGLLMNRSFHAGSRNGPWISFTTGPSVDSLAYVTSKLLNNDPNTKSGSATIVPTEDGCTLNKDVGGKPGFSTMMAVTGTYETPLGDFPLQVKILDKEGGKIEVSTAGKPAVVLQAYNAVPRIVELLAKPNISDATGHHGARFAWLVKGGGEIKSGKRVDFDVTYDEEDPSGTKFKWRDAGEGSFSTELFGAAAEGWQEGSLDLAKGHVTLSAGGKDLKFEVHMEKLATEKHPDVEFPHLKQDGSDTEFAVFQRYLFKDLYETIGKRIGQATVAPVDPATSAT